MFYLQSPLPGVLLALMLAAVSQAADATEQAHNRIATKEQPFTLKLGQSRVIYDPESEGATLTIMNVQDYPMLVKSEVLNEDRKSAAPFVVSPPLFRLDGQQQSRVRIVRTGGDFAKDRETLQWLCVSGIPPQADDEWAKKNGKAVKPSQATINVQVSVSSCIKLLVRPSSIKGSPTDMASSLKWQRQGIWLKVTNPTPFYMNLQSISVGGQSVNGLDYIPPQGERKFTLPKGASGKVEWHLITDFGGSSRPYTGTLQ
ncbi:MULTISPECIES: fimbria/pilus periplasmic chaperone [unclassified Erwinia]|uniref:fimbria/pilus periplasmic chaperone n=1 Tax=unclassified Erwinia TaxID=2622719 RepID=UPI0011787F18|nr:MULTISPECIES: fimbria/pilus periplasmic chaperone [unclassified Erwinia]